MMLASGVGKYAARRAAALPAATDVATTMSGHDALWELAGRWFGGGFGRLALPFRPLLHASGRRLLRVARPSLIDGAMGPGHWFDVDGSLVKTGWDERAFVYQLPFCYDAVYDVAAAASQRLPDEAFGEVARAEYEAASGTSVDEVRWFLYRLLSELDRQTWISIQSDRGSARLAAVDAATEGERRLGALHRSFLSDTYLADTSCPEAGALCAIDIDGVLESARGTYAAPSAASVLALRALLRHGFRPLIATGRSLGEARLRCRDYRLAGAVAEYGAAIYVAKEDRAEVLLSPQQVADLGGLRRVLARVAGVELDAAYQHSVRAFILRRGRRYALPAAVAQDAVSASGLDGRIRIEGGWAQTDFVPTGIDKGTGLLALAERLEVDAQPPLALAVGDAKPDLAMFALARIAAAPANADSALAGRIVRSRQPYGAGLAQAVELVVGHAPGSCPKCAAPRAGSGDAELVLALLRVGEVGGLRKLAAIAQAMRLQRCI
jgi:hydroxymethylpyrimidine pyrophosphatase-like HAD family hydrolase